MATIVSVCFLGCSNNSNSQRRIFRGIVSDSNGKPIPNARVTFLCWSTINMGEENFTKIDTITNAEGLFQVTIVESSEVDVGSIAIGYNPNAIKIKDISNQPYIELHLTKQSTNNFALNLGRLAVFERVYETKNSIPKQIFGIDFLDAMNVTSIDSMDVTIDKNNSKILIANKNGGIVPILNGGSAMNFAPQNGYVSRYQVKGNEKGFFIKCRDGKTYCRLTVFSFRYDRSVPFQDGHFTDIGIMFNVLLQRNGFEFNISDSIRLDYYILENV